MLAAAGGGGGGMPQPNGAKEEHFVPITIVCRHVQIINCRILLEMPHIRFCSIHVCDETDFWSTGCTGS
jgi:hypothetical protein